ncbi:zinc finger protein 318-like isoform X2 [Sphaerodactylus townsendi]|uniref:zinc finger protein 318-like isoform X2 n=1 Tax=Sphaerodactylus townsendi TaxID=933632 RepID=UPI002025E80F|nr:zinc finger protein 318-like isoform X2 [Sphaerodactylus townsendi]XP_048339949.1 zinc finger protein 318-like isoform X2 [Sphaerodactylus townsendi]
MLVGGVKAVSAAIVAMYHSSSGRSSMSSSAWPGSRSSRSGASTSGSTRGRSPRRSRSPSPRGRRRRRRSPSSSHSSRRSPSPRRTNRARSPSLGRRSRRESEQRDGSLSGRLSPGRHSSSSQRNPQFLGICSPSRHCESLVEHSSWPEFGCDFYDSDLREQRRLSDRLGSPDSLSDGDRGYLDGGSVFVRDLSQSRRLERYCSHQESPPSSFSARYDKDYRARDTFLRQSNCNMNESYLQDLSRESDREDRLFTKSLQLSGEEGLNPKHPQYDREDRQLDVSTDPQGSLSEKQNYYKRRLSGSPRQIYPDENFKKSGRKRELEELDKNKSQDSPGSDYVICSLTNSPQFSESRCLYTPNDALAMPKKSILKQQADDPSMQNFGRFLKEKESVSESANLHDDFLLPHERASQDGSGFSHILGRVTDLTNAQENRRHSFLDVDDEEKFLYGDEEEDSNSHFPSTEKLTANGGKESISPKKRPLSPIKSVKLDSLEESRIEYEKIHDLLKTVGLDIGVAEIGKGAARTQERLHGKKTLRSVDGHSVVSHKPDSIEKDCIQSRTHSAESHQKNSSSPSGCSQPSNDVSSASISEHAKSKTQGYNNSADTPEQLFPPASVTPSAPPLLPNLPPASVTPSAPPLLPNLSPVSVTPSAPPLLSNLPPVSVTPSAPPFLSNLPLPAPPISQYSVSHFSSFLSCQVLQNYPHPTMKEPAIMVPRRCNTYGHGMPYSASAWPMYSPPWRFNPAFPDVHRFETVTVPPHRNLSNLTAIKKVTVKKKPKIKKKYVLLEVPITPTDSRLLDQSPSSGSTETISGGENPASMKPEVMDEKDEQTGEQETQQKKLLYLKTELDRVSQQQRPP